MVIMDEGVQRDWLGIPRAHNQMYESTSARIVDRISAAMALLPSCAAPDDMVKWPLTANLTIPALKVIGESF